MSTFGSIRGSEIRDLGLSLIALTIGFSVLLGRGMPSAEVVLISAVAVGTGFLLHELAHKFVAQMYGYQAEYVANRQGLIFIIIMSFLGFILAAPGGVMIRRDPSSTPEQTDPYYDPKFDSPRTSASREWLWIALAGPMTNIVLTILFFSLMVGGVITSPLLASMAGYAFFINLNLAAFNLIPAGPLDGKKIFDANRMVWAVVAVPTIAAAVPVLFGWI
jgi:Zn-dependent protease